MTGIRASEQVIDQDARDFPHDEPCPTCGRRQWGIGIAVDPANPSDAEQETCGACGYRWDDDAPDPAALARVTERGSNPGAAAEAESDFGPGGTFTWFCEHKPYAGAGYRCLIDAGHYPATPHSDLTICWLDDGTLCNGDGTVI